MKKTIKKQVHFCDACGREEGDYIQSCDECGKELCYNCRQTQAKDYPNSTSCSGSADGLYCLECDAKLTKSRANKRHNALRLIQELRAESRAFHEDWMKRSFEAENAVKKHPKPDR